MKKLTFMFMVVVLAIGLVPVTHAQDGIEITFVNIFPDERDVRREIIFAIAEAFTAETGVVVNIESTSDGYGDVFDGSITRASQGNAPHIIQVEDTRVQIAIDSQFFVKMSDYATDEHKATIADIIVPMRNYYGITEDDFWAIPWNASNPIMYYNPDMLTAAGLDPAVPPHTFAEITAACDAIMAAGIEGLEGCINWPVNSWLPEQWVSMQGGLIINEDNGRSGRATESYLDSPEMLNVFTWWKDLADKGYFTYTGTPDAYTPEGLSFITKKTAILLSTSAGISNTLKFAPLMGQFQPMFAPFPLPSEDATNGITAGGAALMVMAGHPDEETQAAVDFAFFLTNTDNMAAWHQASGYYPVRQSSIEALEAAGWFEENPAFYVPLEQLLGHEPNIANAGYRVGAAMQMRDAVVQAAQSVIDSGEDPAEALAAAKQRADKAIAEYNSVIGD
ncbi:MAG: extracellular solute-binding protein [Anaerolineae bacterium]|nr:extracellular solute-binding protein [Anaerolineae bacterium]